MRATSRTFKTTQRRRGTSIAAAVLSLALVAPTLEPVAAAQVISVETVPGISPNVSIHSPGSADEIGTISGSVKEILAPAVGFQKVQDAGKGLAGVRVYAQWYEGEKTQHSSPVYYAETDANGYFSVKLAPYVDLNGVEREFMANATVGLTTGDLDGRRDESREKIRVWAELPESMQDQYRLVHQPAAGIFPSIGGDTTPTTQGDGQWKGNKVQGVTIQYAQKSDFPQHLPQEKWVESTGKGIVGVYSGRAFWNLDVLQGALSHNTVSAYGNGDAPAAGLTVVGSYLNDEAVKKINDYAKKNFAGKTLRGKGWTIEDEQGLQKWINEQIAADGAEAWIAETVKTTTDADGKFSLYWKGIYGNNWTGTGGGINPPAEKLHKLAGTREEGYFENGNLGSKHVNMDWSYVQVLDREGNPLPNNVGMLYPWSLGQWAGPKSGNNVELFGGDGAIINPFGDTYGNWNIALYPAPLKFDVLDKNTYAHPAMPGETVRASASNLPTDSNTDYFVEWTDTQGNSQGNCGPFAANADGTLPECAFVVPESAETGTHYVARLYQGQNANGTLLAQNSFIVKQDAETVQPEYGNTLVVPGAPATSAPKFKDKDGKDVAKPEGARFELKNPDGTDYVAPEGYKVTIDGEHWCCHR